MRNTIQISPEVYCVGSDELSGSGDCMVYAINLSTEHYCLIDAGVKHADIILENIKTTSLKEKTPSHLILTHAHIDHIGAAHSFKKHFPLLKILAHDWDTPAIEGIPGTEEKTAASWYGITYKPVKVDYKFTKDREIMRIGDKKLTIIHTPGHTPGSIAVIYQDPQKGTILFGQDIHGPFLHAFQSNINDWRKSMKKLLALEPDILCEGHYGIFRGKAKVRQFIENQLRQH